MPVISTLETLEPKRICQIRELGSAHIAAAHAQVYSFFRLLIMIIQYTAVSRPYLPPLPQSNSTIVNADTHLQHNNHTHCRIDSLEVVRGKEKSFEIDTSGFALTTSNSTMKVSIKSVTHILLTPIHVYVDLHLEKTYYQSGSLCHA